MKEALRKIICLELALALVLGMLPALASNTAALTLANVAAGKAVTFGYGSEVTPGDGNYGVDAVNADTAVLTDGEAFSPNWWVNNGNPYVALKNSVITGPYTFTVDLGGQYDAQRLCIYSYGRPDWAVYPVEQVHFAISADGSSWTSLGTAVLADATVHTVADPRYAGTTVDIYQFTLDVAAAGRYVRFSFPTNASGLVGIGEIEVYGEKVPGNISTGAAITYFGHGGETGSDGNWGSAPVNAGLSVLTDGQVSPNWWVNNGNPNIGLKSTVLSGPYVFNLDLGAQSTLRRLSAAFYSRTAWGVDAPDSVTYSVSVDGFLWSEAGSVTKAQATTETLTDSRNPNDQAPTIYRFPLDLRGLDARYVKISFTSNALGLVGFQEFEVLGVKKVITNLALGKMANAANYDYVLTGGGTGYEATGTTKSDGSRYTVTEVELASAARLTDGTVLNAAPVTYPSNWSSQKWNSGSIMGSYLQVYRNDSRIITLDLGAVRNITGIRMHFAAVEAMGFYMPTNVTYYLSQDGENYYEAADVWNYQSTADGNDANISCTSTAPRHEWYAARNLNYNARYVKLIFPVNVYILSDELQVFGCETLSSGAKDLTACPKYDPLENYVGHFAGLEQSGGVKNEFMAYSGWYINSDGSEVYNTYKTRKEYMCAIAYVDGNGIPTDWLFDDVTVMGHYYTSSGTFNSYKAGYTSGSYYATQKDWYEWLCYAFGKDVNGGDLSYNGESVLNLEALEAAAASAKQTLNDPDYKVGVKLVLFPAVEYQDNWGTLNGKKMDFTVSGAGSQAAALANRTAAYQWYVDTAVEMWEQANFEHLELTGFYYYEETIHESTDRIAKAATQALTDIVHSHETPATNTRPATDSTRGGMLRIYQLPFYQSEGYWNWAEYGFDYALMQPNYSFYDMYTLTQLEECGNLCKYYGLGMQMEFGGAASTAYHEKFKDYMTYGDDFGYQNAVLSWYMSTWGCINMATNSNGTRYLYDMVYDFVKVQNVNLTGLCGHSRHTVEGICHYCGETVEHTYENGTCTVCGKEESSHSHQYQSVVTPPTCTEAGYTTYTCACGDSYTADPVAAPGHSFREGICGSCGAADPDYEAPAPTYSLVGDMNGWDETAHVMTGDGTVSVTVTLAQGSYQFKIACGETRYGNDGVIVNTTVTASGSSWLMTATAGNCTLNVTGGSYRFTFDPAACTLTVVHQSSETEDDPVENGTITVKSVSLSLEDEVAYNVYFTVENLDATEGDFGLIVWDEEPVLPTVNGGGTVIRGATYLPDSGRYGISSMGIPARNMGDLKYMVVYARQPGGSYVYSKVLQYSARIYCMNRVRKSESQSMHALCVALMNYGAEAQKYFAATSDYTYTELMNAGFEDYQALVSPYSADLLNQPVAADPARAGSFGTDGSGFTRRNVTMSADGIFALNYYFTAAQPAREMKFYYWTADRYESIGELTAENASGSKVMVPTATANQYWASLDGIAARDMDRTVYVCGVYEADGRMYSTGIIAYSLAKYCTNKAETENEVQNLAKAMAVYSYHAKAYFGA